MKARDKSDDLPAVNLSRRRLLIGSAVVGIGGAAAAIRDGELGAPANFSWRRALARRDGRRTARRLCVGIRFFYTG